MQEVAPGVHRFSDAHANWYAIEDGPRLVLVDSGWPRSAPALVAGLAAIGRAPGDVAALALTHGHPDHLGSARWLEAEHGVTVHAHEDELERVRGRRPATRSPPLAGYLWRPLAIRFVATSIRRGVLSPGWPQRPVALDGGAGPLRAVPTPGHTEGHVAYHLPDRRVAFTGDALVTLDVLTGRRGPRLHPAPFQVDIGRAAESLPTLAALDADLVLPGHGEPHRGPIADAVEQALAGR
jgi:glyoxylase-like metal-dependent hydrolase (beta-lactamase superfamily II)